MLVDAEIDGEKLEEHEIVMGFFLLVAAGNDSTKATYTSGMRALMEAPAQMRLLLDDPTLVPGAVEEALRMFPAFAHFRRTATCDTELHGQKIREGEKVVLWYVSSNRERVAVREPRPLRRAAQPRAPGLRRRWTALLPRHRAGAAGAARSCSRRRSRAIRRSSSTASPTYVESGFLNQMKTLPVRLGAAA